MSEPRDRAAWRTWSPPLDGQSLSAWQDGRCAMCGPVRNEHLVTDHCHTTGLVRGKLCHSCNIGEPTSSLPEWAAWRDWDNPAHEYGWASVYDGYGSLFGPTSPLTFMSGSEREDWWSMQLRAAREGMEWPTSFVLSETALIRKRRQDSDLDLIAEAVSR